MNVWILCNEEAGRGLSAEHLRALVEQAGHTVVGVAKQYDEGSPLPAGDIELVVAAGGDGTVATVAAIASRTSRPLAILPLGTANNIAASLGLGAPVPDLIESWSTARPAPFDLGRACAGSKEWLFVESVGAGLVPAGIARAQAEQQRKQRNPSAQVAAAVRVFGETLADLQPQSLTIATDSVQISDAFLLVEVLNIRSIGPNLMFGPEANPCDGYFDIVMAEASHRQELMTYFEHRAAGLDTRLALPRQRARVVTIANCAALHIDDERVDVCDLGPVSIRIEPAAINVLI